MTRDELYKVFDIVGADYMKLKEFPFLWHHTEYVIGGTPLAYLMYWQRISC
jgi:hypothetical protein